MSKAEPGPGGGYDAKKEKRFFYGWWIVIASFVFFAVGGGITFYGFSTLFDPIIDEFGWTRAQTALAFSLRSVEWGLLAPVIGFVIDRLGVRRLVIFGVILLGGSFLLLSRIQSLAGFYGVFLLIAVAQGSALGSAQYVAIANWFSRKRARAMGIISAGFGFSGTMGPVLVWLISEVGWRDTLVILGISVWAIGIPLALVLRHRPEPYGYGPDGDPIDNHSSLTKISLEDEATVRYAGLERDQGLSAREAFRTRTFWLLVALSCFVGFANSSINVHLVPYLTSVGLTREMGGMAILGLTGASLIGRLSFAWMGDFYDKRRLLAIGIILQAVGVFIFSQINSPALLIAFLLVYGPGYGGPIPLQAALQADYFGVKNYATIRGLLSLGWTVSGLFGPLIAGWVFDVWGTYRPAFVVFAIFAALALPLPFFMNIRRTTA